MPTKSLACFAAAALLAAGTVEANRRCYVGTACLPGLAALSIVSATGDQVCTGEELPGPASLCDGKPLWRLNITTPAGLPALKSASIGKIRTW